MGGGVWVVRYRGRGRGRVLVEIGLPADNLDWVCDTKFTASSWESDKISSHVAKVAGDVGETSLLVLNRLYPNKSL